MKQQSNTDTALVSSPDALAFPKYEDRHSRRVDIFPSFLHFHAAKIGPTAVHLFMCLAMEPAGTLFHHDHASELMGVHPATVKRLFRSEAIGVHGKNLFVIRNRFLSDDEAVAFLKAKTPQVLDIIGGEICAWCRCKTAFLHDHHYPIPKAKKGTETVGICPNCHVEFHALTHSSLFVGLTAFSETMIRRVGL